MAHILHRRATLYALVPELRDQIFRLILEDGLNNLIFEPEDIERLRAMITTLRLITKRFNAPGRGGYQQIFREALVKIQLCRLGLSIPPSDEEVWTLEPKLKSHRPLLSRRLLPHVTEFVEALDVRHLNHLWDEFSFTRPKPIMLRLSVLKEIYVDVGQISIFSTDRVHDFTNMMGVTEQFRTNNNQALFSCLISEDPCFQRIFDLVLPPIKAVDGDRVKLLFWVPWTPDATYSELPKIEPVSRLMFELDFVRSRSKEGMLSWSPLSRRVTEHDHVLLPYEDGDSELPHEAMEYHLRTRIQTFHRIGGSGWRRTNPQPGHEFLVTSYVSEEEFQCHCL